MTFLTKTDVLWGLFSVAVVLTAGFIMWMPSVGGTLLDSVYSVEKVQYVLLGMSDSQKNVHFWMTIMLDTAYPFTVGLLLVGLILKYSTYMGMWLALPALLFIPLDLFENVIQLFLLSSDEWQPNPALLSTKAIVTPLKYGLLGLGGGIGLALFLIRINEKKKTQI